eukprot:365786-Chlamydomonas_euryale.AAC.8
MQSKQQPNPDVRAAIPVNMTFSGFCFQVPRGQGRSTSCERSISYSYANNGACMCMLRACKRASNSSLGKCPSLLTRGSGAVLSRPESLGSSWQPS